MEERLHALNPANPFPSFPLFAASYQRYIPLSPACPKAGYGNDLIAREEGT